MQEGWIDGPSDVRKSIYVLGMSRTKHVPTITTVVSNPQFLVRPGKLSLLSTANMGNSKKNYYLY